MFDDLLKIQKEIPKIKREGENPYFNSNYISLPDLLEKLKPILNNNNFILIQIPVIQDGTACLKTEIRHKSGEKLECLMPLISKDQADPQKLGSSVTYMRRYSLLSLLAIEDVDDDGNAASKQKINTGKEKETTDEFFENNIKNSTQGNVEFIDKGRVSNLKIECKDLPELEKQLKQEFQIDSFKDVPASQWTNIKKRLAELKKGKTV